MKKILIPPFFVIISLILIVLFYFIIEGYNFIPFPYNLSGTAVALPGFALMGKSHELFRKHKTPLNIVKSSHMITEGVFSGTRNPMYIGMFLLLLGIAVCMRNMFSVLTPFAFIVFIQIYFIPREERLMEDEFGQTYLDYKKKVRRWI